MTDRSTQRVTKVSEKVKVAITEAFRELAGEEVAITREELHKWYLEQQEK
ncbi:MAG: hypothetical protein HQ519_03465 [Planctomycetes bacterium]|nr:hypothetical protein [Planctomycetota bacterium]